MKCNRNLNVKWWYMVCVFCWGLVTCLKIMHGDEWTSILTYAALTVLWGSLTYKKFKEEQNEDANCNATKSK